MRVESFELHSGLVPAHGTRFFFQKIVECSPLCGRLAALSRVGLFQNVFLFTPRVGCQVDNFRVTRYLRLSFDVVVVASFGSLFVRLVQCSFWLRDRI